MVDLQPYIDDVERTDATVTDTHGSRLLVETPVPPRQLLDLLEYRYRIIDDPAGIVTLEPVLR